MKASNDLGATIYNVAIRYRNDLIDLENNAVRRLKRIYERAGKANAAELAKIEGRLDELLAQGTDPGLALVMLRDSYEQAIAEAEARIASLSNDGASVTSDGQLEMARLSNDTAGPLINAAIGKKPSPTLTVGFNGLPERELQAFAGLAGNGSPLADLFRAIAGDMATDLENVLSDGISLGQGPKTVAAKLRRVATSMPAYRAETIARTEMIRAGREASRRVYDDTPAVTGYVRMAAQDNRVCPGCLALSGTQHKTNEIMPSHPNCRCVMIPRTMSWAELTGDPSLPDTRPPVPNGDQLLAGLTDDEKVQVLGPKRFQLWQNGTPLSSMVEVTTNRTWGPGIRLVPTKELAGNVGY